MSGLFDLTGHVAAVIGGTGVLGGALCHGLAGAGASIAVMGRSSEPQVNSESSSLRGT